MSEDEGVLVEHPDPEEMEKDLATTAGTPAKTDEDKKSEEKKGGDKSSEQENRGPRSRQIVSIGCKEDEYAFTFHEDVLNDILSKIPVGWKVAVVSVVGAFRTGKSFLLSWFLRYLHHIQQQQQQQQQRRQTNQGGNDDDENDPPPLAPEDASRPPAATKWYEAAETLGNSGFDWRGGHERHTTGIWMWNEPFFISRPGHKEPLAVLLVDTQGMFDHETTMALTASIFGLSTLLSSYQVYNVDKRIQEDNLQQLALFSEYARMALTTEDQDHQEAKSNIYSKTKPPFQLIEFLVRDWQHFEEASDDEDQDVEQEYDRMEQEMKMYLEKTIADRVAKDLQDTREQILSCFQNITCFGLVHPGMAVTKKKYKGKIDAIDPTFIGLLDRYCQRIFSPALLQPKIIHDRELTAVELGSYIKAYAELFASGAAFPEASTLLDATSTANNTNAIQMSIREYKDQMDRIAGPSASNYVRPAELNELHNHVVLQAVEKFKSIANFGNKTKIEEARQKFRAMIDENFVVYTSLNRGRNPLAGMETYIIPMSIAFLSYILRVLADSTCSSWSSVCRKSSDAFAHLYAVVMCFMIILAITKARQMQELFRRFQAYFELFFQTDPAPTPKQKRE